jgi:hypothetical protein
VIGKVLRGKSAGGLVRYLFGPGRANDHTNAHVVAGWDDTAALEPPVTDGRRDLRPLVAGLELPLAGTEGPERPVWHCALRTAPGDPPLTDAQWADVAAEVMDRTGLGGDDGGCRWVAVRHAEDHVHLVVTLARQDGRRVGLHNDFYRVGEACRAAEERYGLAVTAGRDRTAARRSARAETEKAHRLGHAESPRDRLRREVQTAAAGTGCAGEFFDRLRDAGVLVRERHSEAGQVTGYAVAWPGFRSRDGQPIWYGGRSLAADLSLPKLEAHWRGARTPVLSSEVSVRVRLRHEVERAAGVAGSPAEFLEELRRAGVLVKERYSQLHPGELTGYAVALPGHGEPTWHGGGRLADELSLPRLRARWAGAGSEESPGPGRRTSRLTPEERERVWEEARRAAAGATAEISRLAATDPAGANDAVRSAADLLHVLARVAEPGGRGRLHDAARTYDRASRDLYGRTPTPGRGPGFDLRVAAMALALVRRATPSEGVAVAALIVAVAGLADAVGQLRAAQRRLEQADGAKAAAMSLGGATGRAVPPPETRTVSLAPRPEPPRPGRSR